MWGYTATMPNEEDISLEETTDTLRRLTESGFSSLEPKREILVPVFSLDGQIRRREPSQEEVCSDY